MIKKNRFRFIALLSAMSILLAFTGCKKQGEIQTPDDIDSSSSSSSPETPLQTSTVVGGGPGVYNASLWLNQLSNGDAVLMDSDAIAQYNAEILENENLRCVDLKSYPQTISKNELSALLDETQKPTETRYNGTQKVDDRYYDTLFAAMNRTGLKEENEVRYGFMTENSLLRAFPTSDPSYEFADDVEFDLFAETMLKVWEPVLILHTSTKGDYYFVQSYNYRGWMDAASVAVTASREEWEQYLDPEKFLVVTGNRVTLNENVFNQTASNQELFMGTVLPLQATGGESIVDKMTAASGWTILLPVRGQDGTFSTCQALVPWNADVNEGYLAYTQEGILRQAFKLLGDRHGWSGMNKSRDASSLIMDIFSSFGIRLPRNSGEQAQAPGKDTDFSTMNDDEKLSALVQLPAGSLLVMEGHMALYLGMYEQTPYILHSIYVSYDASGEEQIVNAVLVTDLSLFGAEGETYLTQLRSAKEIM